MWFEAASTFCCIGYPLHAAYDSRALLELVQTTSMRFLTDVTLIGTMPAGLTVQKRQWIAHSLPVAAEVV